MKISLRIPILLLAAMAARPIFAIDLGTALLYQQYLNNQNKQNSNSNSGSSYQSRRQDAPPAAATQAPDPTAGVVQAAQNLLSSISTITNSTMQADALSASFIRAVSADSKNDTTSDGGSQVVGKEGLLAAIDSQRRRISRDDTTASKAADAVLATTIRNGDQTVSGIIAGASVMGQQALLGAADAAQSQPATQADPSVGQTVAQLGGARTGGTARRGGGFNYSLKSGSPRPPTAQASTSTGDSGHAGHAMH